MESKTELDKATAYTKARETMNEAAVATARKLVYMIIEGKAGDVIVNDRDLMQHLRDFAAADASREIANNEWVKASPLWKSAPTETTFAAERATGLEKATR